MRVCHQRALPCGLVLLASLLTACTPLWQNAPQRPLPMGPPESPGRAPFATMLDDLLETARLQQLRTPGADAPPIVQRGFAALTRHDDAEAMRLFPHAAAQGNPTAQVVLGLLYATGRGVAPDDAEAVRLFRHAAAQGEALGLLGLGAMYAEGRGVTQDLVLAARFFAKAAETLPPGAARDLALQARERVADALALSQPPAVQPAGEEIPLISERGGYTVPVEINGRLTLPFILDTAASEVNIPDDVARTLRRAGTLRETDFLPGKTYTLADGSTIKSARFVLRSLTLGHRRVTNVTASIGPVASELLLGQSFLQRLGVWGIDSQRQVLTLGTQGQRTEPRRGSRHALGRRRPSRR